MMYSLNVLQFYVKFTSVTYKKKLFIISFPHYL